MSKILVLYKNSSYQFIKEKKFTYKKEMKYVLFPLTSCGLNSYVMLHPSKLMDFDYAEIEVTLEYYNTLYDDMTVSPPKFLLLKKKKIKSLIDLMNYLHSIHDIRYADTVLESSYDFSSEYIDFIGIRELHLVVYRKESSIFTTQFKYAKDKVEDDTPYDQRFLFLFDKLEPLYHVYEDSKIMKNHVLTFHEKKWMFLKGDAELTCYGLFVSQPGVVYFCNHDMTRIFHAIHDFKAEMTVFEHQKIAHLDPSKPIPQDIFDTTSPYQGYLIESRLEKKLSYDDIADMVGFVLYLRYVYMTIMMIYREFIWDDQEDVTEMDVYTEMRFRDMGTQVVEICFRKDNIPTMEEILKRIYSAWSI